jgi:hypothetical protein
LNQPPEYVEASRALPGGLPPMPVPTLADARAMMERLAIDATIISTGPPGVFFGDQGRANELARLVNESVASGSRGLSDALLGVQHRDLHRRH